MRRRIACLSLLLVIHQVIIVRAEPTPEASLLSRSGWVSLRLVLGRIEVANIPSSQTRAATSGAVGTELFEKLAISGDTDTPSVHYQRVTVTDSLSFEVTNGKQVSLRYDVTDPESQSEEGADPLRRGPKPSEMDSPPKGQTPFRTGSQHGVPVRFQQVPGAELSLIVGRDGHQQVYRSASLWHLAWSSPEVFSNHLAPLLEIVQPSWRFDELTQQATDALIRESQISSFTSRQTARQLVAQLDHPDFTKRQAADRQLRSMGVAVLPFLSQVDRTDLSREQRSRLDRIVRTPGASTTDSPERIARWLVEDERVWLSLLDHEEYPLRRFAAEHLAKRLAHPLPFDPAAEPLLRAQQVAQWKAHFHRR